MNSLRGRGAPRPAGAEDEIKWLIAREIPHLRRYAFALTNQPEAADDLVQDCLERALRKRHLLRHRGSIRTWLYRIQYTVFIDTYVSRKKRKEVALDELTSAPAVAPPQDGWLACLDVAHGLARLPAEQRAAILLVALEGMTYDEAADILGVPIGTVRSRLSRGRETLRALGIGTDRSAKTRRAK